ncbi:sugar ABC transporter permease [Dehalococcoidia bacterium]|nr:sugar ABC transporter permease [Dehalococcoidia bacterium]
MRRLALYLLIPFVLIVVSFYAVPAVLTGGMAFTDMDHRLLWDFIGIGNFQHMARDFLLPRILKNTVIYVIATLSIFNVGLALVLALVTSAVKRPVGIFFRTLWLLPRFSPPIVYGVIWLWIIDPTRLGFLNSIIGLLGFNEVEWALYYPMAVIVIANGVIGASLGMIIFYAAIQAIPQDHQWMAQVDGANWLQSVRYIIIPQIYWPLAFVTAFQTLSLLGSFEYIMIITEGGPFFASTPWSLYGYLTALGGYFGVFRFGLGSAIVLVLVIIAGGASFFYWKLFRLKRMMSVPKIEVL